MFSGDKNKPQFPCQAVLHVGDSPSMLPIFSASCVLCAAVHASGSWRAHRFGWFLFRSSIILARNHYYLLLPVRPSENLWFRSKELWWGWRSYVALPFHVSCSEDAWDHSPSLIHQSLAESMLHPRPPLGGASEGCFVPWVWPLLPFPSQGAVFSFAINPCFSLLSLGDLWRSLWLRCSPFFLIHPWWTEFWG